MSIIDLNPKWVGTGGDGVTDQAGRPVPRRNLVAIRFDCPCGGDDCKKPWKRVVVQIRNPPDGGPNPFPSQATWLMSGSNFENLTLYPSIQRVGGCEWHGWVKNGEVIPA